MCRVLPRCCDPWSFGYQSREFGSHFSPGCGRTAGKAACAPSVDPSLDVLFCPWELETQQRNAQRAVVWGN